MIDKSYNELEELFLKRENLSSFLKKNSDFLSPFISTSKGITNVEKKIEDKKKGFHATSTGYGLYYVNNILKHSDSVDVPKALVEKLRALVEQHHDNLSKVFLSEHVDNVETSTGRLPNTYNTPLQIAGILSSITPSKQLGDDQKDFINYLIDGTNNDDSYINKIKKNGGFIERVALEAKAIPSPYSTFWVIECIRLYDQNYNDQKWRSVFDDVLKWCVDSLAKSVSFTYSGVSQAFDAIEVSYLTLTILSIIETKIDLKSEAISAHDVKKLVEHAIKMLFDRCFDKGCFTKSLPVFADQENFSLSCPTVEPIALLLMRYKEYFLSYDKTLYTIFEWIVGSKFEIEPNIWGWRSEWEHPKSNPTSFMAVGVGTFLVAFYSFLDTLLSRKAGDILGIRPFFKDADIDKIEYTGQLGYIVKNYFVEPIKNGDKETAHYSMILFGPPGTAKTTITKKIAQDLGWPLHIINANSFLQSGVENIDSEAERIFRLAFFLNRVVILFDEVEELVLTRENDEKSSLPQDRTSRLLTTSMLPRINDLRNNAKVVFIFATNYINHIDAAIKRTGRFDCVHCVMPPVLQERRNIVQSIVDKYDSSVKNVIQQPLLNAIPQMERFCYADLKDLIKRVAVEIRIKTLGSSSENVTLPEVDSIIQREISVGKNSVITEGDYDKFVHSKEKYDRPNPGHIKNN